ncbi:hypothetical protein G7Y89_g7905 [Cudoniella acicularis]|uniref:Enoyl reductase (ER) domain-containing protein n=1 Tax=Cudoniella acicularis TaxID=354080 RepID=A0A8H4RJW5_9HELO|nr:hypothetical protein G7Y89_g7905 [Cudoniella acicularis]
MPTNRSVWQDKAGVPGTIRESPIPSKLTDGELLVKVHAWAVNPADAFLQDAPLPWMSYPLILGEDIAGTVSAVGSTASPNFKIGDRILGFALGAGTMKPEQGGFQDNVILDHTMACKIPDSLSFVDASVFPLCVATAAYGLFSRAFLAMPFPALEPKSAGKSVVVWGGSSAVGCNAIQLSKAAGLEVITTCSARNFDYVRSLGADKVFDYNSASAIDDVVAELDKGSCVGIFQAAGEVAPSCQVAHKSKQKLFVAATNHIPEGVVPEGVKARMVFESDGTVVYSETSAATFGGILAKGVGGGEV